ncbi:hypothetical protein EYR38_010472 [Pleurotus pulmonarius]|nr:hypothetical protein EYR38_010472 [Pleurotus pulmonarius]
MLRKPTDAERASTNECAASDLILKNTIAVATKERKYSTVATRLKIQNEFAERNGGKKPYKWQLNVAEALLLGLDCTVIAGTGAGKTMPFVMPLFIEAKKVVIVISPLNALEEDQASRFRDMKLMAAAVNGETYNDKLHKQMGGGKKDLKALDFLIPPGVSFPVSLPHSFVFFDEINVAIDALEHLRNQLPSEDRGLIHVYHSRRSLRAKVKVLASFREGKIDVLLSTEAAGMRAGRAGRDSTIKARAVLLVQPSIFQEVKAKSAKERSGSRVDEGEIRYRKEVDPGLREWIETEDCRHDAAAGYFDDQSVRQAPTGDCCDNCLRRSLPLDNTMDTTHASNMDISATDSSSPSESVIRGDSLPLSQPHSVDGRTSQLDMDTSDSPNQNGKRPLGTDFPKVVANRRGQHLADAHTLIRGWRYTTWKSRYVLQPWGTHAFMTDKALHAIALHARLSTVEDLIKDGWGVVHARRHGLELLERLRSFDNQWHHDNEEAKIAKREAKKQATAQRNAVKAAEKKKDREAAHLRRLSQPKPPRPSRAKTRPAVASSSRMDSENIPPCPSTPLLAIHRDSDLRCPTSTNNLHAQVPIMLPPSTPFISHSTALMTPYYTFPPVQFSPHQYESSFTPLATSFFYSTQQ